MKTALPEKPFFLIRHGQTVANELGKTSGIRDVDLTPIGLKQAELAAILFKALGLKNVTIFTSPLKRALKTAKIINQGVYEIIVLEKLMERNFGLWEGQQWKTILRKLEQGLHPPMGETNLQHLERSLSIFTYILNGSISMKTTPLIVSHGGSFYTFGRFYNQTRIVNVGNCELYYFEPLPVSENNKEVILPWKTWSLKLTSDSKVSSEGHQLYAS